MLTRPEISPSTGALDAYPQQREDWAAELARQYIEATLNVPVETWDQAPRQGAHDLRYDHDGRSTAVEVKLIVNPDYRALAQRIARTGYVRDSRLTRMWSLRLKHGARVDQALRDVPDLLIHLEQRGWLDRRLWLLRNRDPVTAASLDHVGVTSLWSQRPTLKHPPGFYLMPEPWGGWEQGIEALSAFVSDLLAVPHMARLRRQLANAQADEHHAFLFLGWEHMESVLLHPREAREVPAAAPSFQNRSMDYGLQASRRPHEFSPGILGVGGSKVGGGLRIWSTDPLHAMQFRAPPLPQVSGVRPAQRPSPSDRDYPLYTAGDRCLWHVGGAAGENHVARAWRRRVQLGRRVRPTSVTNCLAG